MPADLTPSVTPGSAPVSVPAAVAADAGDGAPAADFAALFALELHGGSVKPAALPAAAADGGKLPAAESAPATAATQDPAALLPQCAAPLPPTLALPALQEAAARNITECVPGRNVTARAPDRGIALRGAASAVASAPAAAGAPARDAAPVTAPAADTIAVAAPASAPTAALRSFAQESPRTSRAATEIADKPAPVAPPGKQENAPPVAQVQPPLPPVASSPALHAASAEGFKIGPRIGSQEWGGALGQRVVWMVGREQQVAELHLNPPDLGPLQVVLSVSNDQASAQFFSHHAVVREAVEAALPQLRQMLADNGIALGQASVSSDAWNRQTDSGREQGGAAGGAALPEIPVSPRAQSLKFRDGLVDTFA